jgi:hypothetical protein
MPFYFTANSLVVDATELGKYFRRNRSGPRTVLWSTPDVTGDIPDFTSSSTINFLCVLLKEAGNPLKSVSSDSIEVALAEKSLV